MLPEQVNGVIPRTTVRVTIMAIAYLAVKRSHFCAAAIAIGGIALVIVAAVAFLGILPRGSPPARIPASPEGMAFVPAGEFIMGSDEGRDDEKPMRRAYLEAFYIDRYEATHAEYVGFLNAIGGHQARCGGHDCVDTKDEDAESHILYVGGRYVAEAGYERHPVIKVSWYGAQTYCEHRGKRLPSEAEWEKAARGATGFRYPWGDEFDVDKTNVDQRVGDTTPVGSYEGGVSPYGAHDMAGNVWEWVADWYQAYPGSQHRSEVFGQKYKVLRGGSWNHPPGDARSAARDIAHPARRIHVVGFRCAR